MLVPWPQRSWRFGCLPGTVARRPIAADEFCCAVQPRQGWVFIPRQRPAISGQCWIRLLATVSRTRLEPAWPEQRPDFRQTRVSPPIGSAREAEACHPERRPPESRAVPARRRQPVGAIGAPDLGSIPDPVDRPVAQQHPHEPQVVIGGRSQPAAGVTNDTPAADVWRPHHVAATGSEFRQVWKDIAPVVEHLPGSCVGHSRRPSTRSSMIWYSGASSMRHKCDTQDVVDGVAVGHPVARLVHERSAPLAKRRNLLVRTAVADSLKIGPDTEKPCKPGPLV